MGVRLPDFVVIGAGKSGTTTLARWLEAQPDVFVSDPKEPNFFANDEHWARGVDWYASLFSGAAAGVLAGEATTAYADPTTSATAAARMASVVPDARLVYLVRHPIHRLRSQYRYRLAKGVEALSLAKAVRKPGNRHVGRSLYHACIAPYLECFERDQLVVVRFEDLVADGAPGWGAVLEHLGLPHRPAPGTAHNVTAQRRPASAAIRWWRRAGLSGRVPAPLRPVATQLRKLKPRPDGGSSERLLARGDAELPADVVETIWADVEKFEQALGTGRLWDR